MRSPDATPSRPTPAMVALVVLGGAAGTAARAAIESALPVSAGSLPWPTLVVNVTGSFALGLLLGLLGRRVESPARRALRWGAGTGLLGGFTTYSTFALEVDALLGSGAVAGGLGYAVGSVVLGVAAAAAGLLMTRWHAGPRSGR